MLGTEILTRRIVVVGLACGLSAEDRAVVGGVSGRDGQEEGATETGETRKDRGKR